MIVVLLLSGAVVAYCIVADLRADREIAALWDEDEIPGARHEGEPGKEGA